MKTFRFLSIAILIGLGLLTTGCYTQMHLAYEWDQPTASGTSSYYSWDDDEQSQKGYLRSTRRAPHPSVQGSLPPEIYRHAQGNTVRAG